MQLEAEMINVANAMGDIQTIMHSNPGNAELATEEVKAINEYKNKHKAYMYFLRQKAKATWLKDGDDNSTIFHQSIRQRRVKNFVNGIYDMPGCWKEIKDKVKDVFLDYYKCLFGTTENDSKPVN